MQYSGKDPLVVASKVGCVNLKKTMLDQWSVDLNEVSILDNVEKNYKFVRLDLYCIHIFNNEKARKNA